MKFQVEIDGIAATAFSEVFGIEADVAVVDYRPGNDKAPGPRKLPGETHFSNLVLKRGMTADLSLWNWMKQVLDGQIERRNLAVVLFNDAGEVVLRFTFRDAWPVKWSGPILNGQTSDIAIETLELAHEGLLLQA